MNILKPSTIIAALMTLPLIATANTQDVKNEVQAVQTQVEKIVSDTVITAKIKELFLADKDISSLIIHVTTKDQVVFLTGKVKTPYEKKIAVNLAKTVHGVQQVKCKLKVLNT